MLAALVTVCVLLVVFFYTTVHYASEADYMHRKQKRFFLEWDEYKQWDDVQFKSVKADRDAWKEECEKLREALAEIKGKCGTALSIQYDGPDGNSNQE